MNQICVDLNRLAGALRERRAFSKLERMIRRFHGKVSAKTDLDSVRRAIDQLNALMLEHPHPKTFNDFQLAAGEALCFQAVVVYCRALVAEGVGRFPTGVAFPDALAAAHKRIVSLRNHRLCHYGDSEDEREASWSDDRAVIVLGENKLRLRFATSRRGWDVKVVDDLDALTAYAIDVVTRQATAETEQLFDEILSVADDPIFMNIVQECKFEPHEFFANLAQADAMASEHIGVFNGTRVGVFVDN